MSNEIINADLPPMAMTSQGATVDNMLTAAIDKGISPEALERLVALRERIMAQEAESAFTAALLAFQHECPLIGKSREVDTGKYKYKYAELSHIVTVIQPLLRDHGLSFSFDAEGPADAVVVACIIRHVGGHSTRTRFPAKLDANSAMNATQKVASAITYARRYALVLALGLTVGAFDDDGRGGPPEHENPERDHSAPKNQPRDRREKPITKDDVGQVYQAWAALHPPTPADTKESRAGDFSYWVEQATGVSFPATKPEAWTRSLLQQAMNAAKDEQEVRQA
jgi:hypothetical protein